MYFVMAYCEGEFKIRHNNHTKSFRHKKLINETELSKCIWGLKDIGIDYQFIYLFYLHFIYC